MALNFGTIFEGRTTRSNTIFFHGIAVYSLYYERTLRRYMASSGPGCGYDNT